MTMLDCRRQMMALPFTINNVSSEKGTSRSERRTSLIETRVFFQDKIAAVTFSHQQCQKMLPVAPVGAKRLEGRQERQRKSLLSHVLFWVQIENCLVLEKNRKRGTKGFLHITFQDREQSTICNYH